MKKNSFAVFILSHGRPNSVTTIDALRKTGYTGKIYIVIDNEDSTADEYRKNYGDMVIQFDKKATAEQFDTADTTYDMRAVVYARHASQKIAQEMGLEWMMQLDDDYSNFYYKYPVNGALKCLYIKQMDNVFDAMIEFMEDSNAKCVGMCQGGDLLGGINNDRYSKGLLRKVMNMFLIKVDSPIDFLGRINDDVNSYVVHGSRGDLFFTIMFLQLVQVQTQKNAGGMTELYLNEGTYQKSFYSVMMAPSCVSLGVMGTSSKRLHHTIRWDYAVPKILNQKYKKVKA